jgi:hypothetical protein
MIKMIAVNCPAFGDGDAPEKGFNGFTGFYTLIHSRNNNPGFDAQQLQQLFAARR